MTDGRRSLRAPKVALELLLDPGPLGGTLDALARQLDALVSGARAAIFVIDETGLSADFRAGPSLPPSLAKDAAKVALGAGKTPDWSPLLRASERLGLSAPQLVPIALPGSGLALGTIAIFGAPALGSDETAVSEELSLLAAVAIQRHRTESTLRGRELELRRLLESVNAIIYSLDAEGRFTFVSPNWTVITGHSAESTVGRPLGDFLHPDDVSSLSEYLRKLHERGSKAAVEYRVRNADGTVGWHASNAAPIWDDAGKSIGCVGVAREITDKKKLEAQLILADRMVSVGTLAAGVAHEINNPLSYVLGNLSFVAERLRVIREENPPLKEEMLELERATSDALDGAHRVKGIVMDLKTFSRTDEQSWGYVDIVNAIEFAVRMTQNEMRHRARLVRSYTPVPKLVANEARLGQVFVNLLINAIQALPEERTDQNEIRLAVYLRDADTIVAEVKDSGPGVPREIQSRIFDPFFTTKPAGVGTGLGLSICHGIVASIGGKIELESAPGEGALFRVCLPVRSAIASPPQPTTIPPHG